MSLFDDPNASTVLPINESHEFTHEHENSNPPVPSQTVDIAKLSVQRSIPRIILDSRALEEKSYRISTLLGTCQMWFQLVRVCARRVRRGATGGVYL